MAIYHFSGQVISRSQGRSSVAAAAYRSAEKMVDLNTGLTHDFNKKQADIFYKEILLPENAPEQFKDRAFLWNEVEQKENRKDAQLAREFNISLPKELSESQNVALIREFVQEEFVDKGMIADVCLHRGHSKDGEPQPHAHVMLTMREITQDGFGQKVRTWNDKKLLFVWRERWAEVANRHLFLAGYDLKIDHRSFEQQGIDLEPQNKIGPKMAEARREQHEKIARANGDRILEDPNIALEAITKQQSTFTHQDVARFVNRHTADADQFQKVYDKVLRCEQMILLGKDNQGRQRFTTQNMLKIEKNMLTISVDKSKKYHHVVNGSITDRFIQNSTLTEEQQVACRYITQGSDIACVTGFAGTGKSYMLGVAREAWEAQGFQVRGMTLSGKAAENLEASSGIKSHTVASRIHSWDKGYNQLTNREVIVIDEAGMLGSTQMNRILKEVNRANAKLVLIGDPEQLQAIQAGAAYRAISERIGYVELRDIRRQKDEWQKEATINFATSKTTEGFLAYEEKGHVHGFNTQREAINGVIERWDETRTNNPDKSLIMLAYTRDDVKELNEQARDIRREYGELGEGKILQTEQGKKEFAEGDRVYFLKNEYQQLEVKNGTLGTIEKIDDTRLWVRLDSKEGEKARVVSFDTKDYNHLDYGYAATIHKAQGATVDRSFVLTSKYLDRHASYVAMSRHRDGAEVFWSREEFPDFRSMVKNISREREKDITLDYAKTRDLEIPERVKPTPYQREKEEFTPGESKVIADRLLAAEERDKLKYKQDFEKSHPEVAIKMTKEINRPIELEKKVLEAEKRYKDLNKDLKDTLFPNSVKNRIKEHAYQLSKQPDVMKLIKERDSSMAKDIEKFAKQRMKERALEKDIGRSL